MIRILAAAGLLALAPSLAAAQSAPDPGARAFLQCRACHTLKAGEPDKTGPNLHGVFGSVSGTSPESFEYSQAMKDAKIVWDDTTLDGFIKNPHKTVPGTKMAFAGIADDAARAALIAYLRRETQ
jgi:cytochrome c